MAMYQKWAHAVATQRPKGASTEAHPPGVFKDRQHGNKAQQMAQSMKTAVIEGFHEAAPQAAHAHAAPAHAPAAPQAQAPAPPPQVQQSSRSVVLLVKGSAKLPFAAAPELPLSATVSDLRAAVIKILKRRKPSLNEVAVVGIAAAGALLDDDSHVQALWNLNTDSQRFDLVIVDAE